MFTNPTIFILAYLSVDYITSVSLSSSRQKYDVIEEVTELEDFVPTEETTTETSSVAKKLEGEVQISPYIIRKKTCDSELCWSLTTVFLDLEGNLYPAPAGHVNSAGDGWAYIDDSKQIFTYDVVTGGSQLLMSVLDTTDGVSFEWNPDDSKLAIVVVNQEDESYHETYGSKLFMFSLDPQGQVLQKDRYLFKIRYGCHDAGCDSIEGEDFYFVDDNTFVYYTWDIDPYIERTEEFKRTLEL